MTDPNHRQEQGKAVIAQTEMVWRLPDGTIVPATSTPKIAQVTRKACWLERARRRAISHTTATRERERGAIRCSARTNTRSRGAGRPRASAMRSSAKSGDGPGDEPPAPVFPADERRCRS